MKDKAERVELANKLIERYKKAYKHANRREIVKVDYSHGWYYLTNYQGGVGCFRHKQVEKMTENLEKASVEFP
jgi:hypothetical protein